MKRTGKTLLILALCLIIAGTALATVSWIAVWSRGEYRKYDEILERFGIHTDIGEIIEEHRQWRWDRNRN